MQTIETKPASGSLPLWWLRAGIEYRLGVEIVGGQFHHLTVAKPPEFRDLSIDMASGGFRDGLEPDDDDDRIGADQMFQYVDTEIAPRSQQISAQLPRTLLTLIAAPVGKRCGQGDPDLRMQQRQEILVRAAQRGLVGL